MASTIVFNASAQYTPPAAPVNSGVPTFILQASHNAQQVGAIDVPSGTAISTTFNISFGYVNRAKLLIVKNLMTSDVEVRINGSTDPIFTLPPGGMFMYGTPADPTVGTHPMTSASITTTVTPLNMELVQTWVFGD